jgi:hypothetical protein
VSPTENPVIRRIHAYLGDRPLKEAFAGKTIISK